MRYKFYREHKYVSVALNDLERLIAKTDFTNPQEAEQVRSRLKTLIEMLKGHSQYENEKLHTLLKKKGSKVYCEIEEDHKNYDEQMNLLEKMLNKVIKAKKSEEKIELGYNFYLWYRKYVGDALIHVHEEETIILPELQKLYSDKELKEVEAETYKKMTVDQIVHMLDILFPHMNIQDKEAFLREIKEAEPKKFNKAWKSIQPKLTPAEQEAFDFFNHR